MRLRGVVLGVCVLAAAITLARGPAGASAAASPGGPTRGPAPVTGGGGFADAPLLDAGLYSDTLLPRETIFYAVSLRAGERLRARATVDVGVGSRSVQEIPDAAGGFLTIGLLTPLRQQVPRDDAAIADAGGDLETVAAHVDGPRVLSARTAGRRAARNENWTGPGVYVMAITLSEITRGLGATVELPLRLAIDIDGEPRTGGSAARASPGPLGDARTGPPVMAAAARAQDGSAGEPVGVGLLVVGAVGGILLGAAAGYGMAARRRRTT